MELHGLMAESHLPKQLAKFAPKLSSRSDLKLAPEMISGDIKRRGGWWRWGGSPAGTLWALVYFNSFSLLKLSLPNQLKIISSGPMLKHIPGSANFL